MKHTLKITIILIILFLAAQLMGLFIVSNYLTQDLPLGIEKPQVSEDTSFVSIFIGILLATFLAFMLIRFRAMRLWKLWFFISISFCLSIAFAVFVSQYIALAIALALALIRIFRPNMIVHNITELFLYGGIAAIFVPILNIWSVIILLILVAVYDAIAVWKTKHMIHLAKFMTKSKLFVGLSLSYSAQNQQQKTQKVYMKSVPIQHALLGGGDIALPLIFSGVMLKVYGLLPSLVSVLFTTISLSMLFLFSEKKKFYPAIPYLTAGCLVALMITKLFLIN